MIQLRFRFNSDRRFKSDLTKIFLPLTCVRAGGGRPGEPPPEPGVPERGVGRHPRGRVPLQAPPDEVQEERVVASLQRSLKKEVIRSELGHIATLETAYKVHILSKKY